MLVPLFFAKSCRIMSRFGCDTAQVKKTPVQSVASAFRRGCEAESRGHNHQVGEFIFRLAYCDLADAEFATDLFIPQAGDHQRHDLPFAAK